MEIYKNVSSLIQVQRDEIADAKGGWEIHLFDVDMDMGKDKKYIYKSSSKVTKLNLEQINVLQENKTNTSRLFCLTLEEKSFESYSLA